MGNCFLFCSLTAFSTIVAYYYFANVLKNDINDHYILEFNLNLVTTNNLISKRNYCVNNKLTFAYKLCTTGYIPLNILATVTLVKIV